MMIASRQQKYRMYVDEVGNSNLRASWDPNHRYLSLTGVILELGYVSSDVFPTIEGVKQRFFGSHPDDPVILHRKELLNKKHPFENLKDPVVEQAFNADLLRLMSELDYTILTVVVDKLEHEQRYRVWRSDPYHYCLRVLVERFVRWLDRGDAAGDVMAESGGGNDDMRLKQSFERVCDEGTEFVPPELFAARLTSRRLKVKPKSNNIAGLQLADLIAHPSYRAVLAGHGQESLPMNFGGQIAEILERSKYDRSPNGKIEGWGRKRLP